MKKTLALILAVLVAFSMFSVAVFAADESTETPDTLTITFKSDDGEILETIEVRYNDIFTDFVPADPQKPSTDKYEYTFKHWLGDDGKTYVRGSMNRAVKDATYTAVFAENEIKERQSLLKFFESIFERINMIFRYFAEIFRFDNKA